MFGGSTIDLRNANLHPGVNVLDLFAMFGGTSIIVPPDWTVHVEVSAVLGGFSDKRVSALKVVPDPEKTLIIKGFVMFGGGDVKLTR
ncbi:cell wall-active antibiotics response protein [Fulvivirga maritima]|nr:LiaF domain-containing protein [Fulvivirga maritima]UII28457.1 cell wall-active antibiotics response protein [Fulvivirga maritima]